ncbi:hypothetical protein PgNI_11054 [Pyricularia grisea]|uniref:Uncharacterized protein n=1 Tax=Pyricularia grisea TaxID=148305 RepID=A0A6P8AXL0_PYRGI|nr:hypothetical protein PgNI_11054 [Pyricularia grisea]TLD07078.1 hypothetical protein PgNI_11054 [Pyricularia grisea]
MQLSTALLAAAALALFPEFTVAAGGECIVKLHDPNGKVVSWFIALAGKREIKKEATFSWSCSTNSETCEAEIPLCIVPKNFKPVGEHYKGETPKVAT